MNEQHKQTSENSVPAKARPADVPQALANVALIDAPACAAVGAMSVSWWHAEVAARRAPQPVVRRPRCTRWRLTEVAAFWRDFGSQADDDAASAMKAQATKASAAARSKRRVAAKGTAQVEV